jgi:hypothetical protein
MTVFAPARVAASVGRALWGEVSPRLRSVQFRATGRDIALRFYYEGDPDDGQHDSMGFIGAEVAADFPDAMVMEEAIPTTTDSEIECTEGWHTAYGRKEPSLAR